MWAATYGAMCGIKEHDHYNFGILVCRKGEIICEAMFLKPPEILYGCLKKMRRC